MCVRVVGRSSILLTLWGPEFIRRILGVLPSWGATKRHLSFKKREQLMVHRAEIVVLIVKMESLLHQRISDIAIPKKERFVYRKSTNDQAANKPASFTFIASTSSIMDCYYVYGRAVFLERRLKQSDLCVSVPKNRLEVDTTDKRGKNVVFNVCTARWLLAAVCTFGRTVMVRFLGTGNVIPQASSRRKGN